MMKELPSQEIAASSTALSTAQPSSAEYPLTLGNIDNYRIVQRIGRGRYSEVFEGLCKRDRVVIKVLKPVRISKINREVAVLTRLSHPNIIPLRDVVRDSLSETYSLIFGYVPHRDYLDIFENMQISGIRNYTRQILEALAYAHSCGIVNRDIKPQNLIFNTSAKQVIVIDWGLAEFYQTGQKYSVRVSSRYYKAPELLVEYPFYDYAIDIWSFGCILAELVFKKTPFFYGRRSGPQISELMDLLGVSDLRAYLSKYKIPFELSPELCKDMPEKRVSLINLLPEVQQPIFKEVVDLLDSILVYDHSARPSAQECLEHPFYANV